MRKLVRWNVMKSAAAAMALGLSGWGAAWAAGPAVFDLQTGTLTLPELRLNANTKVSSVVLRFENYGELRVDDPNVGQVIEFVPDTNVLRIPSLSLGGVLYPAVSLTGPSVTIVSYGPIEIDSGAGGNYTLVLSLSAMGNNLGEVARLQNVPKPANQAEFCGDANLQALRDTITQQSGGMVGTLTLTGCTFNGNGGQIAMNMTVGGMPVPYVATYSYQ